MGSTNKEVLGITIVDGRRVYDLVRVSQVRTFVLNRIESLLDGNKDCDPVYCFVKPEPHKKKKLEEGRVRLISGVSLLDSLIDRMLFQDLTNAMQRKVGDTPIAIGWNPIQGSQLFYQKLGHHDEYFSKDISHHDWSLQYWAFQMLKKVLLACVVDAPSWYKILVNMRFECLFGYGVQWEFQDGHRIIQQLDGIMKSGCFLTLWGNSIIQLLIHFIALFRLLMSGAINMELFELLLKLSWFVGDDSIHKMPRDLVDAYLQTFSDLGFTVRSEFSQIPEFVGFIICKYHHLPAYRDKHAFRLQHLVLDDEIAEATLRSYQLLYANDREALAAIRSLVRKRNIPGAYITDAKLVTMQNV